MANPTLAIRRLIGEPPPWTASREAAGFGPTLALALTFAFACFLLIMSAVWVAHPPGHLPGFAAAGGDQNQGTKTALYAISFAVILPLTLLAAPRVAGAIAAGPNGRALPAMAGVLAGSLAATLMFVRLSDRLPWGDGTDVVLAAVGLWGVAATALVARAIRPGPWRPLLALAGRTHQVALAAGVLVFGAVLCVATISSFSLLPLLAGAALAAAVVALYGRQRLPDLSPRAGLAVDVVLGALLLLAIPNLLIFNPSGGIPTWLNQTGIIQFHQNFLLGPANQVLAGGVLLAKEPVSQYGVGSVYFLAGWFHLAPIGYGTYGFLDGLLTALYYLGGYTVLRVARVPRLLAACALALGVAALVYNLEFPPGALPQQGPLRFGLPVLVIVPAVIGARWPALGRPTRVAALAALALASVWALEGFAYTLFTFAAIVCVEASLRPSGSRRRWLARQAALAVGACVAGQLVFALATLAAAGTLPHWGQYGSFVHAFLLGGQAGSITYGFARWSPGVAVAALYLASAAAIVLLIWARPEIARRERVALVALAGTTAHGIALFSYFDNRSATYLLLYVALPALLTAVLWLRLVLRSPLEPSSLARRGALAFCLALAVIMLAAAWPSIGGRFARTPLAEAFPGGHGLRADLRRLWHPPPLDPRAPEGARLLAQYMPGRRHVLIVVSPDLGVEILLRAKRANELPVGDPIEESFVAGSRLPLLRQAIARLRPGERILLDANTWSMLGTIRRHAGIDPLRAFASSLQTPLQGWILQRLDERFNLRPIHGDSQGFIVAELGARR